MLGLDTHSLNLLDGMLGRKLPSVRIGERMVGQGQPAYIIGEVGINHNGDMATALRLIDVAAESGLDAVKFQKRSLPDLYQQRMLDDPNRFEEGFEYLIPILKEVEFTREQYLLLQERARQRGLAFLCTPFDERSVDFLEPFDLPAYKVASADLNNLILLERLIGTCKPLILSTGMSPLAEIDFVGRFLAQWNVECILLHCVSAYPTPPEDTHLDYLHVLQERYGVPVGLSSHEIGFEISVAAAALGACVIERHITLDKRAEGPDHAASLEPDQLGEMVRRIRFIETARGNGAKNISRIVIKNREALGKSLVAVRDIRNGEPLTRSMVCAKGPAKGLSPLYLYELLGKKAQRDIARDEFFREEDCRAVAHSRYVPAFASAWGFKGRFIDLDVYRHRYRPRFVEVHLNDKDVDYAFEECHRGQRYPFALVLHYPTYWHRGVMDLASRNEDERRLYRQVTQRVIDLARRCIPFFSGMPKVVIHLGGMDIYPVADNQPFIENAYRSLRELSWDGVVLLPENNPPRPWYFSGQWYDNAFCAAEEMLAVCREFGLNMCFDSSHAKLYANVTQTSYDDYVQQVAPLTTHLHLADAYGIDGEGMQIGEGEIDFGRTLQLLAAHGDLSSMTWTPEIWQGHDNDYAGFLTGFERLAAHAELRPLPEHVKENT